MPVKHHVLLIPGFFGFAYVGDFAYFGHVRDILAETFRRRGVDGTIRVVETWPTASLRRRAKRLIETLVETLDAEDGVVHLVGHSSGGLDGRLVVSPGIADDLSVDLERYASRVRTVVSLASPHRGSPLAFWLTGVLGRQILRVLSLLTMHILRTGRVPISIIFHLVRLLSLPRLPIAAGTLLNQIYQQLLADFSADKRRAVEMILEEVGRDQSLLVELGPDSMARFNEEIKDRPGVRYGSVVSCARPPSLASIWTTGMSPFRQATHALYAAFHRITGRASPDRGALSTAQADALVRAFGHLPGPSDNDGMVPTLSQVWGEVVHAAWADHLDVIGHFYLPMHVPPHFDWLNSGSHFTLDDFDRMWADVARFLLD